MDERSAPRAFSRSCFERGARKPLLLEEFDDFLAYGHPYRDGEKGLPGITPP
jgi:hypothetical protein